MANILTDPPFAADPPVKLNVPAKTLGLVIGILAIIGIIIDLIALPVVFALNNSVSSFCSLSGVNCGTTGIFGLAIISVLIGLVGSVLYAFGGFKMYQLDRSGKNLVIYGLVVNLVGGILAIVGYGGVGGFIFSLIIAVVIYYLVIISRWPGDAPLVATAPPGGYGSPPPPPPPSM